MIIVGKYDASQILQALALQFFWLFSDGGLVSVNLENESSPLLPFREVSMKKISTHASDFLLDNTSNKLWNTRWILWLVCWEFF